MPYRLGYGGGFYDRTLAAHPFPTVGVAYDQAETVSLTLMACSRLIGMGTIDAMASMPMS